MRWLEHPTIVMEPRLYQVIVTSSATSHQTCQFCSLNEKVGSGWTVKVWKIIWEGQYPLGDAKTNIGGTPCQGSSTFAENLQGWHRRIKRADGVCTSEKTTRRYRHTNWVLVCSFDNTKRVYDTAHRECLAVILADLLLWSYFESCLHSVKMERNALKWISILK